MAKEHSESGHVERLVFAPDSLLDHISNLILDRHANLLPDLSSIVVIVPTRAASGLKRALMAAAAKRGYASLLQAKMLTLADWAAAIPIATPVQSELQRGLEIFNALKRQRWFAAADTMMISAELLTLCNELSARRVKLPNELSGYTQALARHYTHLKKINADLNFEAQLTFDIWRTLATPGENSIDAQTRYAMQLKMLSASLAPLYVVGTVQLQLNEQEFLASYRGPVTVFDDVPLGFVHENNRARFLSTAWKNAPGGNAENFSMPNLAETNIALYAAHDIEDEAHHAASVIKLWLTNGKRDIAIVAQDRLSARRLRALLERDAILLSDEIGWPYSTTSSGTAIMRWLEALQDDFYFSTLIDLIKSPFIFADLSLAWGRPRLKSAVLLIERSARQHGIVSGIERLREILLRDAPHASDAIQLIDRLRVAQQSFVRTRQALSPWLAALNQSLSTLGIVVGLNNDAAGRDLLAHLDQWRDELQPSLVKLNWSEWCQWLRAQLEAIRFRDASISSPVVLTSLAATRYRHFDAVLMLGASAKNLPGAFTGGIFFNQAVRSALGLSTKRDAAINITEDLFGLFNRADAILISWQSLGNNEPQLASPWVSSLALSHQALFGSALQTAAHRRHLFANRSHDGTPKPAPIAALHQLPQRISASGYQSLLDCPYQFFARYRLGLRVQDNISEEMEKRDYGEFIHKILYEFHRHCPLVIEIEDEAAHSQLQEVSAAIFKAMLDENFVSYAWFARWRNAIPAYLAWQRERERAGWRWHEGEKNIEFALTLARGETITINGRIDRVDMHHGNANALSVIDYKTQSATQLAKRLQGTGEDVQLPIYVALLKASDAAPTVDSAAYLSIDANTVKAVSLNAPEAAAEEATTRLTEIFSAFSTGTHLPAQGIDEVCRYCEMRGLCRRDYW